jgi:competence protein ComEC
VIFFWIILGLGLWRKQAFILTSLFLLFYILMIGAPPFAIRAGIMGFLFLLAQYLGRSYSFQNAIIIAATLILIFNPLSLFYDISFQLSFISILAIFLLFPLLQHYTFQKIKPQTKKRPLLIFFVNTLLISIAILLFLGPLIAYYFGNLPAISPLINLIIIPLLPPLLFFGIISLLISIISLPLSLIFSSIVYLLLAVMIELSHFFAHLPFIDILQFRLPLYLLIIYYIVLVIIIFKINKTIPHFSLLKI